MTYQYDMCVDQESLFEIEERLRTIKTSLELAAEQMQDAIQRSLDFLAGDQFDKAREITENNIAETKDAVQNIENELTYIRSLQEQLEKYNNCAYDEAEL